MLKSLHNMSQLVSIWNHLWYTYVEMFTPLLDQCCLWDHRAFVVSGELNLALKTQVKLNYFKHITRLLILSEKQKDVCSIF